jgi:hypothetical protein
MNLVTNFVYFWRNKKVQNFRQNVIVEKIQMWKK